MKGFKLFLSLFAACAVVGGAGGWWLWTRYGADIKGELDRVRDDARSFAAAHEQDDCVPEAFTRLDDCKSTWCKLQLPLFTRECLDRAEPSPKLCESLPDSLPAALVWPTTSCVDIAAEPEICQRILRELATHCLTKRLQGSGPQVPADPAVH
jgi:hypothetical protein